ncbi:MAG: hypothetical protein ACRCT2_14100, partial [Plesiomonas shigelloides]
LVSAARALTNSSLAYLDTSPNHAISLPARNSNSNILIPDGSLTAAFNAALTRSSSRISKNPAISQ